MNTVKQIWARDDAVINGWLTIPSSFSAEVMARQGYDSIVVDMQHGAIDYQSALPMLQAISTTGTVPMVRVPWNEPGLIMKMLDAGAMGVICPMVNNADEAEALVRACKYPPRGYRSCGPVRAKYLMGDEYLDFADEMTIVMPQIETKEALAALKDILAVPGIDGVYVGPSDLAMALGSHARRGQDDKVVLDAIQRVAEVTTSLGKAAGIHTPSAKRAHDRISQGYRFATIASDDRLLAAKAKAEIGLIRELVSGD